MSIISQFFKKKTIICISTYRPNKTRLWVPNVLPQYYQWCWLPQELVTSVLVLPGDLNTQWMSTLFPGRWVATGVAVWQELQCGRSHNWLTLKIEWPFAFFHLHILPKLIQYPVYLRTKDLCALPQCHLLVSSKL